MFNSLKFLPFFLKYVLSSEISLRIVLWIEIVILSTESLLLASSDEFLNVVCLKDILVVSFLNLIKDQRLSRSQSALSPGAT